MQFHYFVFLFLSLAVFATEEDDLHEQAARFFKIVEEIKIVQVKRDPQSSNNSNNKLSNKIPFVRILKGILHPCDFAQLPASLINDIGDDAKAGASVVSQIVNGQNPTFLKSIPTAIAGEIVNVAKEIPKIPEEILDAIEEGAEEAGDIISQIAHGQVPTQLKSIGGAIVTAAKNVFNDIGNLIEGKHPTSTAKQTTSAAACVQTTTAPRTTAGTTIMTTHATVNTAAAAASASNALRSSQSVAAAYSSYYRASSSYYATQSSISAAQVSAARASSSAWSSYYRASSSYYASISAAQAAAASRSAATTSVAPFSSVPNSFTNAREADSTPTPVDGAAAADTASSLSSNSAASTPTGSAGAQAASSTTAAPSSIGAARPSGYVVASLASLIAVLAFVLLR